MKAAFAVVLAGLVGAPSHGRPPNPAVPPSQVPKGAVDAVKGALPKGWSAEAKGDTLVVRREREVSLYNPIGIPPNAQPAQLASSYRYEITLTFRPLVKPEEYAKLANENAQLDKTLEAMREAMRAARINHKFDDWLPSTPEQKGLVAAYRDALKGRHKLPDLHSGTHSIDISDTQGNILLFVDEKESSECAGVKKAVTDLFKPYRPERGKP